MVVFVQGLMSELKELSLYECVSVYFKLNPTRLPYIERKYVIDQLINWMEEQKQKEM